MTSPFPLMVFWKSKKGQTSLEILIALSLFLVFTTAGFVVFFQTVAENSYAQLRWRASALASEGMEAVREIRDRDFDELTVGTHGLSLSGNAWLFSGTSDVTDNRFTRTVTVSEVNTNERDVTVGVAWNVTAERLTQTQLAGRFTNWNTVEVWGNWGNPVVVGAVDIGPTGKATSVGILASDSHVALTAEAGSGRPTLYSIDVGNPTAPTIVDTYVTGDDLRDVRAVLEENEDDDMLYTTGILSDNELRTFELETPNDIEQEDADDLNAAGHGLFVAENFLYVGAENGLHIFDIQDRDEPVEIGFLALGTAATDVAVADNIAYIATPKNDEELMLVNVSIPALPIKIGSIDTSQTSDGISVAIRENRLYLGTLNASSSNPEIFLYDRTDPANPVLLNSIDNGGDVNSLIAVGPYLFTAGAVSNREFTIYRVDNASSPTIEASLNMSNIATGLDFRDNTIYISLRSNDAFQIVQPGL